ncbi:MAG: UDP-2,3-diacylglucosamine diphosphatase LpxI [Planctomycetaceae bacterium]|nr:UDP-2,3-diacylglucosamine diphosphatase LpxI [Planctomycetaceae bacterium]
MRASPVPPLAIRPPPQPGDRIGILAGNGRFPIVFAEAARRMGLEVYCAGVLGMTSEDLPAACTNFIEAGFGKLGKAIRYFNRHKVTRVVMAGKIEKTKLYERFRILRNLPDWRTLHMLFWYATKNHADDTMLTAVIREFQRDGIDFESAVDLVPELLVKHGFLTRRKPSSAQWRDIHYGWELAKAMGGLDVGQSVVVAEQAVLAVEAIEGTDACIKRCADLCPRGGFTVVKVAKPQQDRRFDMPTIGPQTIKSLAEAGGRVLAIESDQTIILDQAEAIELANRFGIAIVALNAEEIRLQLAS